LLPSLGIIMPKIDDFYTEYRDYPRTAKYSRPRSAKIIVNLLPFWIKFRFHCKLRSCSGHWIICEDMEIGNYYRRLLNQVHGRETVKKAEKKMTSFLDGTTPYFLMGTRRRYRNRWLIISIINPQAKNFYAYKR